MSDWTVVSRTCPSCGVNKPASEFHRNPVTSHGLYTYCKVCTRKKDRDRRAAKRAVIDSIKLAAGCMDCGYDQHPAALHFDHRPGETKEFNIGEAVTWSLKRLLAEIDKCDVVCANCHAIRTAMRGYWNAGVTDE